MIYLLSVLVAAALIGTPQSTPPDTEIFLAALRTAGDAVTLGPPLNVSSSPGYDNQPSFAPDGAFVLFTSGRGAPAAGGRPPQTDIYQYDIKSKHAVRLTDTPESEYSPTVTPDGRHFSVIRVEADGTQRLWRFTRDGSQPELVLTDVKPVGYHAWADDRTLALFVLGTPATLQVADTRTGKAEIVAKGIGRSIQRMPGGGISFVQREPRVEGAAPTGMTIMRLDASTRTAAPLVRVMDGAAEADVVWTPDGLLLMAHGDALYSWRKGRTGWTRAADLAGLGLKGVTRLAVSPGGDWLALVAAAR
jgi:hypothetical protein